MTRASRDVLLSIRPRYVSKIFDGHKTVELRRRFPGVGPAGIIALIYCSSPTKAVVGYARINQVLVLPISAIWQQYGAAACISKDEFHAYFAGLTHGCAIQIGLVTRLKKQVSSVELEAQFGIVPPQSYRYVSHDFVTLLSNERLQTSHRHKRTHRAGRRAARAGIAV
jgi:predicted transcriptional regulator